MTQSRNYFTLAQFNAAFQSSRLPPGVSYESLKLFQLMLDAVSEVSSSSVGAFTDLSDVPSSYSGAALKALTVNAGATGLVFTTLAGGGDALTANPLSQFAATTSAQLRGVISDETGSGLLVFATSPTLTTPLLGTPTSGNLANCTGYPTTGLGLTASSLAQFASTTSAELRGLLSDETGTGSAVFATSPTLVTPILGTPQSGNLSNCTGYPTTGLGLTASSLAQFAATTSLELKGIISDETGSGALVFATSPTLVTPALGTPSALVGTNITGIASSFTAGTVTTNANLTGHITSVGNSAVLGSFTSAQLLAALTDETGTGANVFANTPTLVTPVLGAATATTINGNTLTTGTYTLTGTAAKTLNFTNSITLTGTDATIMTFPTTSATIARTDAANTFTGVQTITNITLLTNGQILLTVPTNDGDATGNITNAFNSGYSSTAVGDLVYLDSSSTWQKCDANTLLLYNGLLGIALEVKASGAAVKVALPGSFVYAAAAFPTFTIGLPIYMSETPGLVTQTAPTTTDAATRVIGWGIHADKMYFFPSPNYITHT